MLGEYVGEENMFRLTVRTGLRTDRRRAHLLAIDWGPLDGDGALRTLSITRLHQFARSLLYNATAMAPSGDSARVIA